jgi:ribonuclease-3
MKSQPIAELEQLIAHQFTNPELLEKAITHSSYARELESQTSGAAPVDGAARLPDNEQLEFLGDAVLGLVTSRELFDQFPGFHEGELSKIRAFLVSESHLIGAARQLQLGRFLRLSRGEEKSGGRDKPAVLVDALEAVLAAIYLDAGLGKARDFILRHILKSELSRLGTNGLEGFPVTDFKSALQETAHSLGLPQPSYVLIGERGPAHKKVFTVEARIDARIDLRADLRMSDVHEVADRGLAGSGLANTSDTQSSVPKPSRGSQFTARADGATKKAAEQLAAGMALGQLKRAVEQRGMEQRNPLEGEQAERHGRT